MNKAQKKNLCFSVNENIYAQWLQLCVSLNVFNYEVLDYCLTNYATLIKQFPTHFTFTKSSNTKTIRITINAYKKLKTLQQTTNLNQSAMLNQIIFLALSLNENEYTKIKQKYYSSNKRKGFLIPEKLYEEFKTIAISKKTTANSLIQDVISEYIQKNKEF